MGSLSQFWGRRALPAAKAAVCALQLLPDGQSVQILALTNSSLDCWQVSPAEPHTHPTYHSACHRLSQALSAC